MPTLQVEAGISVGSRIAFIAFVPYCNRCGLCCERLITWQMTQKDPDDPKTTPPGLFRGVCVYLDGKPGIGKTTSCEITDGTVNINDIPQYHRDYYNKNCGIFDDDPTAWPNKNDEDDWGTIRPIGVEDVCSFRRIKFIPQQ